MEPDNQPRVEEMPDQDDPNAAGAPESPTPPAAALAPDVVAPPEVYRGLRWTFIGPDGLRAGWSVLLFVALMIVFVMALGFAAVKMHLVVRGAMKVATPGRMIAAELLALLAALGAAAVVARIERRRVLDYNLTGPRRPRHFLAGLASGFAALSLLVGALAWGHWLHIGPSSLSGGKIFLYALLWGCVFFLVGCTEEGIFRCYLQFTLTRGLNFWWALGINAAICLDLVLRAKGNGVWGVYAIALLGLLPCLMLHQRAAARSAFWQAAWVTSTLFGFVHTTNGGENWIGIFQAAFVGFVFCVSIRVTGSAWWAIGCHAGWDWAQTYFYGTADSGLTAQGHYFTSSALGNALFSGGADGPEGSLLGIGIILLLLIWVVAVYGRRRQAVQPAG